MKILRTAMAMFGMAAAMGSHGQGFNLDLDDPGSPPEGGGGTPSTIFPGSLEANQKGYWNSVDIGTHAPIALRDLDGHLTAVTVTMAGSGGGGGYNFSGDSGDYRALMNDRTFAGERTTWTLTGLLPGRYRVVSYAVSPDPNRHATTAITGAGSITPNPQYVTGPIPYGNVFILGRTHAVHVIDLTGSSLLIEANRIEIGSCVNGFQIVPIPVPEPGTALAVAAGLIARDYHSSKAQPNAARDVEVASLGWKRLGQKTHGGKEGQMNTCWRGSPSHTATGMSGPPASIGLRPPKVPDGKARRIRPRILR